MRRCIVELLVAITRPWKGTTMMTASMRRLLRGTAVAAAGAASIAAVSVTADPASGASGSELAAVRAATAKYHRVETAIEAGYTLLDAPCFESADGGMGIHYTNGGPDGSLFDSDVVATEPDSLVYEVTDHGLRLVAVEYIAAGAGADSLTMLGQPLHNLSGTPLYILHAWVWSHNPDGMFADYNPKVGPCPSP